MSRVSKKADTLNLNQLSELARTNPKYAKMFSGLAQIDNYIKKFVEDIVCNEVDPSIYFIKTELMSQCYTLYLFNSERQAIVGVSWPLADFLTKCESKMIEYDVNTKVKQMIQKFGETGISTGDRINWIY
jgi:hemoglobin-like flavoprotein